MSWPADGLPRFKVVECSGWANIPVGNSGSAKSKPPGMQVAVLDRASCHRAVGSWSTEKPIGGPGHRRQLRLGEKVPILRQRARALAAELNAEHAA